MNKLLSIAWIKGVRVAIVDDKIIILIAHENIILPLHYSETIDTQLGFKFGWEKERNKSDMQYTSSKGYILAQKNIAS